MEEDQPNSMQAALVSTSLLRAVSSILQWSKHFGVSDTGTSELFRILHKVIYIIDGSDNSITSMVLQISFATSMMGVFGKNLSQ